MLEQPRVFLSYAREDQLIVGKLYLKLKAAGLRPWMDVEDIEPGAGWQEEIDRAIAQSSIFLACLSPRSVGKAGVLRQEIEHGRAIREKNQAGFRVIPVRLEPCDPPQVLQDLQWIDLYDPNGWDRLLLAIRPKRPVRALAWGAAALAILAAGAFWIYSRPCDFASTRVGGRCSSSQAMVGATFWRLRPSTDADPPGIRSIIQPKAGEAAADAAWTPVRMSAGMDLKKGDRFYVSIESTQPGYLYVINQEQYTEGRTGSPELIFPTQRTRQGDNRVEKDTPIRLPAAEDSPPYFEVSGGTAAGYQGEIFTAILLPRPIQNFEVPRDHQPVAPEQFSAWRTAWLRQPRLSTSDGGNSVITEREARAQRASEKLALTSSDPAPRIVYQVPPGSGGGLWVDFSLRVQP